MLEVQEVQSSSTPLLNGSPFNPSTKDFIDSFGERSSPLSSLRSDALACLNNSYSVLNSEGCILGSSILDISVENNSNSFSTTEHNKLTKQQNLPDNWWECKASEGWKKEVTDYFLQYLSSTEDRSIVLFNEDTEEWLSIPYVTRFQKKYLRKVKKRLEGVNISHGFFLSFTIDPKDYANVYEATKGLNSLWNKLLSLFKADKKRKEGHHKKRIDSSNNVYCGDLKFLRVLEFGTGKRKGVKFEYASHLPHLHVIISGIKYLDFDWLNANFPYYDKFEPIRGSVDLKSYVLKYVKKGLCVDYAEIPLYPALYWLTNCRLYSASKGLLPKRDNDNVKDKEKVKVWVYMGVYSSSSCDRIGDYIAQWKKSPPSFDLHEFSVYWNSINTEILKAWANEDKRYLGMEKKRKLLPYGGGAVYV